MLRRTISLSLAAFTLSALAHVARSQDNWPQFRGADSRGVAESGNPPSQWSTTENVAWKTDLPGRGWSSPIVWGQKIFLTTCVNLGESEEPKKGLYFGGDRAKPPASEHQWKVICLDLSTGNKLWEQQPHQGVPATPIHLKNSYASETPVTDGQRVYALFGNLGIYCYDMDGKPLWSKKLDHHPIRNGWGTAASPVVYQDRVYVVDDNDEASYLLALDARDGAELFRVERDERSNWATPFIWKNSQRVELITPGTKRNRAYDLEGRLLWELGGMSTITIAAPYAKDDLLYISSGYVLDSNKPIFAIKPGATGDITLDKDATKSDYVAWCNKTAAPYNPSTLLYGDLLYVLYDMGFFGCFDANTGEEVYKKRRIPDGKAFTASPWAYGGKVFCLNEDGACFVIRAGNEFEILGTNTLADDDMCMATPAIVGDRLLVRTAARLYCIAGKSAN